MTKPELMKEVDAVVEEFFRTHRWGKIEVTFQNGVPVFIRHEVTKTLAKSNGETHAKQTYR